MPILQDLPSHTGSYHHSDPLHFPPTHFDKPRHTIPHPSYPTNHITPGRHDCPHPTEPVRLSSPSHTPLTIPPKPCRSTPLRQDIPHRSAPLITLIFQTCHAAPRHHDIPCRTRPTNHAEPNRSIMTNWFLPHRLTNHSDPFLTVRHTPPVLANPTNRTTPPLTVSDVPLHVVPSRLTWPVLAIRLSRPPHDEPLRTGTDTPHPSWPHHTDRPRLTTPRLPDKPHLPNPSLSDVPRPTGPVPRNNPRRHLRTPLPPSATKVALTYHGRPRTWQGGSILHMVRTGIEVSTVKPAQ